MKDIRICKVIWNTNNWETPCARAYDSSKIGVKGIGFEKKYGYVHEDWLFNPNFQSNGKQFGFIDGLTKASTDDNFFDKIYLFTINPNTKERFYVGHIINVTRITPSEYNKKMNLLIKSNHQLMLNQLKSIGANYRNFDKHKYKPNIYFNTKDVTLFQTYIPILEAKFIKNYYRTMPYFADDFLMNMFDKLALNDKFIFEPSTPFNKLKKYRKTQKALVQDIDRLHQNIEEQLYKYLLNKGHKAINLACDSANFGANLADIVTKDKNGMYSIYEIKTNIDFRRGLRESLGQLLDYSHWHSNIKVNKIVSVLPYTNLSKELIEYCRRMKNCLNINFQLLMYNNENGSFEQIL